LGRTLLCSPRAEGSPAPPRARSRVRPCRANHAQEPAAVRRRCRAGGALAGPAALRPSLMRRITPLRSLLHPFAPLLARAATAAPPWNSAGVVRLLRCTRVRFIAASASPQLLLSRAHASSRSLGRISPSFSASGIATVAATWPSHRRPASFVLLPSFREPRTCLDPQALHAPP
jgi:hypothetical protein